MYIVRFVSDTVELVLSSSFLLFIVIKNNKSKWLIKNLIYLTVCVYFATVIAWIIVFIYSGYRYQAYDDSMFLLRSLAYLCLAIAIYYKKKK
jgi:hypothetical protein